MKYSIHNFTKEEKVKLVMGTNLWSNDTCNNKVGTFVLSDASVGIRHPKDLSDWSQKEIYPSIAYPSFQTLAQTWNSDLAKDMGECIANDCIDLNVDVVLGPGVNIKRTPLCGRNFEYLSEDPLLAGLLAKSYIQGVEEHYVGTCIKHFCCNNSELARNWMSSEVDERTLREIYLKPFEIAFEASPMSLMCSYNLVNGVRMSENKRLYDVCRDEYHFNGLILSDWDAVKDPLKSLHAGLNLEMPYHEGHAHIMEEHLKNNEIDEDSLDKSAQKVLDFIEKCEENKTKQKITLSKEQRLDKARQIAEEGIVLAKNDGVLPLNPSTSIMLSGTPCVKPYYFGGGSSGVKPTKEYVSLEQGLKNLGFDAKYEETITESINNVSIVGSYKDAIKCALTKDVAILCIGDSSSRESEAFDRDSILVSKDEYNMVHYLRKYAKKIILLVYAGSVIDLREIYDECDAIVFVGYSGEESTAAICNILSGKVNPSGRFVETYAYELEDYPSTHTYQDEYVTCYEEQLNVGYRYFVTRNVPTLFPFGFGLSYSTFEYKNFKIEAKENNQFDITLDIENISDIDGKEVVQIYVEECTREVYRPTYELKAFKKVFVPAHQSVSVTLTLDESSFSYYSVELKKWTYHPGFFRIRVQRNAEDLEYEELVTIK